MYDPFFNYYIDPSDQEYDEYYYSSPRKQKKKTRHTCKFCGKEGLTWINEDNGKWQLYDKATPHVCETKTGYEDALVY